MAKELIIQVLTDTIQVSFLVLIMMVAVDLLNVWTRGAIASLLKGARPWRQYVVASAVGTIPGCIGGFTNVSLYIHGMISFGALVGAMAAVSGDEAFVMLALFPNTALVLFAVLFVLGIVIGWVTDRLVRRWHIRTCEDCGTQLIHRNAEGFVHYVKEHLWQHIIRRHLCKTALWTFGALLVVELGLHSFDLQTFTSEHALVLLFLSAGLGLIPESGPHLIIVTMYANGLIPFSVLLTSALVQDGHGMLPMLAYSFKDSMKIKAFNLVFGLGLGLVVFLFGW